MSFQVCIKTDKSLQQLAAEIRDLFSLPPFKIDSFTEEPYCQFETLGMQILLRPADDDDRDPEVKIFPIASIYRCLLLIMSLTQMN